MLASFSDEQCLRYRHYSKAFSTAASNLEAMKTAVAPTVALRNRAEKGYQHWVGAHSDVFYEAPPVADPAPHQALPALLKALSLQRPSWRSPRSS